MRFSRTISHANEGDRRTTLNAQLSWNFDQREACGYDLLDSMIVGPEQRSNGSITKNRCNKTRLFLTLAASVFLILLCLVAALVSRLYLHQPIPINSTERAEPNDSPTAGSIINETSYIMMKVYKHGPITTGREASQNVAEKGQFPWLAAIRKKKTNDPSHWCGGTLIHLEWVISAAHCVREGGVSQYMVRLGDSNSQKLEGYEKEFEIEELILHPEFGYGPCYRNDIALIKFKGKAEISDYTKPACLPKSTPLFKVRSEGSYCHVSGWGFTENGKNSAISETLKYVSFSIVDDAKCARSYNEKRTHCFVEDMMFCAGPWEVGKDSCEVDSGGPLVCRDDDGIYVLTGIASFDGGCANTEHPGVYTNVQHYTSWINEQVGPERGRDELCHDVSTSSAEVQTITNPQATQVLTNPNTATKLVGNRFIPSTITTINQDITLMTYSRQTNPIPTFLTKEYSANTPSETSPSTILHTHHTNKLLTTNARLVAKVVTTDDSDLGSVASAAKNSDITRETTVSSDTSSPNALTATKESPMCGRIYEETPDIKTDVNSYKIMREGVHVWVYPWDALVRKKEWDEYPCFGTLIDRQWVLSAADCFRTDNVSEYVVGLRTLNGRPKSYPIEDIIMQKQFINDGCKKNDIALIKLSEARGFNKNIHPVCLPTPEFSMSSRPQDCQTNTLLLTDDYLVRPSAEWIYVAASTVSKTQCITIPEQHTDCIVQVQDVCINNIDDGTYRCSPEFIGPIICRSVEGKYIVAGIVSFGDKCGFKVYTSVLPYLSWINEHIYSEEAFAH